MAQSKHFVISFVLILTSQKSSFDNNYICNEYYNFKISSNEVEQYLMLNFLAQQGMTVEVVLQTVMRRLNLK